ncbi:MAG: histone deacetylase [Gammaproteobacteria bacterium]|nr:histone deacetylase [Gammaproteobacteria bacterium]MBU0850513.1 histone deacetylase [Gammaproteobacteria bacterium]MBU1268307.1 histone deacetylase [Gammaproteobacteria bacterium]MBU1530151.1 histone deacetylase [Gammaproteobacteria bacterium]MBU1780525.1 histone deacetylase [Gammaproteobacteria bacterium]
MIEAFYTDEFVLPLPAGHRFPMEKYRILRDKVAKSACSVKLSVPEAATGGQLALAHCPTYIHRIACGEISDSEQKEIGFPWSERMVERSLRSVGATVAACRSALQHGASVNLAGGTHHAMRDKGGGFCVFNDLAVAARVYQTDCVALARPVSANNNSKVLVVDLDVHQGDGTACILADDPSVFTFSMHGEKNYPFKKSQSDLDIALPDGTRDAEYVTQLEKALCLIEQRFQPDLVFYVAGLDVHQADRLGKLALSDLGIEQRDSMVLKWAEKRRLPVVTVMAGGYFSDLEHLTDLQFGVIQRLAKYGQHYKSRVDLIKNSK